MRNRQPSTLFRCTTFSVAQKTSIQLDFSLFLRSVRPIQLGLYGEEVNIIGPSYEVGMGRVARYKRALYFTNIHN